MQIPWPRDKVVIMSSLLKTKKLDSVIWAGTPGKDTQNTVPASENRFGWFLVFLTTVIAPDTTLIFLPLNSVPKRKQPF